MRRYWVRDWGWQGCWVGVTPWKVSSAWVWALEGRVLERCVLGGHVLERRALGGYVLERCMLDGCVLEQVVLDGRMLLE